MLCPFPDRFINIADCRIIGMPLLSLLLAHCLMVCPLCHLHIRLVSHSQTATSPSFYVMTSRGNAVRSIFKFSYDLKVWAILLVHLSQPGFYWKPFQWRKPALAMEYTLLIPQHFSVCGFYTYCPEALCAMILILLLVIHALCTWSTIRVTHVTHWYHPTGWKCPGTRIK